MKYFQNKVAIVTGASSGIGRALSIALAGEGCRLAIADLDPDGLRETAGTLQSMGAAVITCRLDVAKTEEMKSFAAQVIESFGRVDILVNNAGIAIVSLVEDMNHEAFNRVMEVNFWGVYNGISAFLPYLREQSSGQIVNISSVFGLMAVPSQAAYNCSKFAVRALSEALAQELTGTGVSVSCVYPGGVQTNIARRAQFHQAFGPVKNKEIFTKVFEEYLAFTTPEKAARTIVRGIRKKRARILVGPDAHLIDLAQRLFPAIYQKVVPAILRGLEWKFSK